MFRCLINQMSDRLSCAAVCIFVIACASTTLGQNAATPLSAEALLRDVIEKYRTLKTYSDEGTFIYGTPPQREDGRGSFEIRFARPSLKFSCKTTLGSLPWRTIWWSDERANYVWSSLANR